MLHAGTPRIKIRGRGWSVLRSMNVWKAPLPKAYVVGLVTPLVISRIIVFLISHRIMKFSWQMGCMRFCCRTYLNMFFRYYFQWRDILSEGWIFFIMLNLWALAVPVFYIVSVLIEQTQGDVDPIITCNNCSRCKYTHSSFSLCFCSKLLRS